MKQVKVRLSATDAETGKSKVLTQHYLTDAQSVSESESMAYSLLESLGSTEFVLLDSVDKKFDDIRIDEAKDAFYEVKIKALVSDLESGKEKVTAFNILVSANSTDEASEVTKHLYDAAMFDYEITNVKLSKISEFIQA